jgi:hypothetical protein
MDAIEKRLREVEMQIYDYSVDISAIRAMVNRVNAKIAVEARKEKVKLKERIDDFAERILSKDINNIIERDKDGV